MEFRPEPVDLAKLVGEVRDILRSHGGREAHPDRGDGGPGAGRGARPTPAKLKQVLYNYLSNALKFTPTRDGKVTVRVRPEGDERLPARGGGHGDRHRARGPRASVRGVPAARREHRRRSTRGPASGSRSRGGSWRRRAAGRVRRAHPGGGASSSRSCRAGPSSTPDGRARRRLSRRLGPDAPSVLVVEDDANGPAMAPGDARRAAGYAVEAGGVGRRGGQRARASASSTRSRSTCCCPTWRAGGAPAAIRASALEPATRRSIGRSRWWRRRARCAGFRVQRHPREAGRAATTSSASLERAGVARDGVASDPRGGRRPAR